MRKLYRGSSTISVKRLKSFINGQLVDSEQDGSLDVVNPANGKVLLQIPVGCEKDVDMAVSSAVKAFKTGCWSRLAPSQKKSILHKFADLITEHAEELDRLDAEEMGKPVGLAVFNALGSAGAVRFCAEAIDKIQSDLFNSDQTTFVGQRYYPRGVVAGIIPWNFPTYNVLGKAASALAAGNCVVLKPSEYASQSAILLAKIAMEAGLPAGVFSVVLGAGDTVGKALALHNDIDMVTFTGSTAVGRLMMQYAGQSNMKAVHAECGGKSPQIVFADGVDLDAAADSIVGSLLMNQGQVCSMGSRVLVAREIQSELVEKIVLRLTNIVPGDPLDPKTTYGPVVSKAQLEKIIRYIELGKSSGAELIAGGNVMLEETGGYYVEPTVFNHVPADADIAQEEIFGPVLCVIGFDSVEDAIAIANGSAYGLMAYVWSKDLATGMKLSQEIDAGIFCVNACAPTGEGAGYAITGEPRKLSGMGVEGGLDGIKAYFRKQLLWFNYG